MRWMRSIRRLWRVSTPWLSALLLALLIIVPLSLFTWMALATDLFRVQAVTVLDGREHTTAAVEQLIQEELSHVPLQRSIFLIPTEAIESRIQSDLPQVRFARVIRTLPDTLRVLLQEKTPALLLLSNGKYYLVDDTGIAYEEAQLHTLPGIALPTVKNADTNAHVMVGGPAVSTEFVAFVKYIVEHLDEALDSTDDGADVQVAEIRIPSLAAREVHFILDSNWVIKFDVTRDPAEQLAILGRIVREMVSEEERTTLEYIDLRIPNRVYYKTRE